MKLKRDLILYGMLAIVLVATITAFIDKTICFVLLGVVAFLGIMYLCYRYVWARWAFSIIACLALIGGTGYCGYQLNTYYSAEGGIWGKINGILEPNKVIEVEDMTFDFSNMELVATGNENEYSAKIYKTNVLTISEDKTFGVFVNDAPCGYVESGVDYVRSDYTYTFKGEEMQELCKDTLQFRFALNKTNTEFTIKTNGGTQAVKYWNYYFAKNNFVVSIKPVDYVYSGDISIGEGEVSYALANYYVDETKWLTQLYHIGDKVNFPFPNQISTSFLGWSTDKTNILDNYTIQATTDFYAVEAEETIYTLNYIFEDEILASERIISGNKADPTKAPNITGYKLNYWADANGNAFDYVNTTITSNTNLYANCTAEQQRIQIRFALADDQSRFVDAGDLDRGEGYYFDQKIFSGKTYSMPVRTNWGFNLKTDSAGQMRYVIKTFDNENGKNQVSVSEVTEMNFTSTGYTTQATLTISNINTSMEILVLVDPIPFNIQFTSQGHIYATAYNITRYGDTFSILDYITADEAKTLRDITNIKGWCTMGQGNGDKYFDSSLNMLKPWKCSGYRWNGVSYEPSNIDVATRTVILYAFI